jgi:hypothetical protein
MLFTLSEAVLKSRSVLMLLASAILYTRVQPPSCRLMSHCSSRGRMELKVKIQYAPAVCVCVCVCVCECVCVCVSVCVCKREEKMDDDCLTDGRRVGVVDVAAGQGGVLPCAQRCRGVERWWILIASPTRSAGHLPAEAVAGDSALELHGVEERAVSVGELAAHIIRVGLGIHIETRELAAPVVEAL